ncbi:MAG TPA: glycosyltransferase family 87 protein [Candidatus Sulfotelmatobacter sp.]
MAASVWIWVQDITIAHQETDSRRRGIPRGNLSDLYPRWLGARELLLHGRDPYAADVTREIQTGYYGRPLDPTRPNDPKDQQAFAYPLYVVLVLAPTVRFPFPLVQRAFLGLLLMLTASSVLLWLRALQWRISLTAKLLWTILVVGSFPAIQGFKLQQLTLLVAALLAAAMACLVQRRFVIAGVLLAIASIKPQLLALVAIWIIIWISGNWRDRRPLFWGAAVGMALLLAGSAFLLPGWISEFGAAMSSYYQYTGGGRSILDESISPMWGRVVSVILVLTLMVLLWKLRREPEGTRFFQWSMAAVLATTLAIVPMFAPYNQVLLVPCVMLALKEIRTLWHADRLARFFVLITAVSLAWGFVSAAGLALAWLFLPATTVQQAWRVPMAMLWAIPVSLLGLMLVGRKAICSTSGAPSVAATAST